MREAFVKLHRAANDTDYESWGESETAPTLNVFDVGDVRATTIIVDPPITFAWQNGGGYKNSNDGLAITVDGASPMTKSQVQAVAYGQGVRDDGLSHTLTGEGSDASEDGTGRGTPVVTDQKYTVRRLTPTECERLQSLPDGWTEFNAAGKRQSDSARYKQLGNAVTSNVAEYVAALIMHADAFLPPRDVLAERISQEIDRIAGGPSLADVHASLETSGEEGERPPVAPLPSPSSVAPAGEDYGALNATIDALPWAGAVGPHQMTFDEMIDLGLAPRPIDITEGGWE
jgi:hypothetical protein